MPNAIPPVYASDYSDQPEDLAADGTVPVPSGPGLGVEYDWQYIIQHRTAHFVYGAT
jgi:L-alanine-DL-glutamate epimerase-like enolase superfamily enzyme